jgi:hypothetical protein
MSKEKNMDKLIPAGHIEGVILFFRGHRVILDRDLAALYGVTAKRLNEQVRRNRSRFPSDFMFQLCRQEYLSLRSQFATLKAGRGQHRKYLPLAFTEHGALMAATVLNSMAAVQMSIRIVRTFVQLRRMLSSHVALGRRLAELEKKYDVQFKEVFDAIRQLMDPKEKRQDRRIGFHLKVQRD